MKNISVAYRVFAGISAIVAAFSWYLVCLAISTQSDGAWLFGAFGLMFSVLPAFALVRVLAARFELFSRLDQVISPPPKEHVGTRFAPHWMLMGSIVVIVMIVLYAVIKVVVGP